MDATWGTMRKEPIMANERFYYSVSVSAVRPLDDVTIKISLPKEVGISKVEVETLAGGKTIAREERKETTLGDILWRGDLRPKADEKGNLAEQTQIVSLHLVSRADGRNWTTPIQASIDLDYFPLPYKRGGGLADWKTGHYRRTFTHTYKDWLSSGARSAGGSP